ncbi:putative membrane protein [Marisediminicola sp. UYEF4]|uniref:DUF2254 domain-containing protein n=1 Tax=Marisediminicola sp. UYEF4 TaxID=1756384 RepID=UPI003392C705
MAPSNPQRRGTSRIAESLRAQLWPVPSVAIALAIALGIGLPILDEAIDDTLPAWLTVYLFQGGADAARAVLQAIAGSLITVTALTFSLTVVTLQLASSQFSPRLLRTFTSDGVVHWTLGLLLGTFVYSLTVLRTVRTGGDERDLFIPVMSTTLAYVLAVASVIGLVAFLAHLVRELRIETMLTTVHREASAELDHSFPDDAGVPAIVPSGGGSNEILVGAAESGFLLMVDEHSLLDLAIARSVVIRIDALPGSSLVRGVPLATLWPQQPGTVIAADDVADLRKGVAAAVSSGSERTIVQDAGFGLRQLIDVTAKALSPGINDPTTAVHALGHAAALLCDLAARDLGPRLHRDDNDRVCVIVRRPTFAHYLDLVVAQPRLYGIADPAVTGRLLRLLQEVAWNGDHPAVLAAVRDQLARMRESMARQEWIAADRTRLNALAAEVDDALDGRWRAEAYEAG